MPAVSEKQRELFAIAEHMPDKLHSENKGLAKLPKSKLREFARPMGKKLVKQHSLKGGKKNG